MNKSFRIHFFFPLVYKKRLNFHASKVNTPHLRSSARYHESMSKVTNWTLKYIKI